jgi:hypothetical protein
MRLFTLAGVLCFLAGGLQAQDGDPLAVDEKLLVHALRAFGPAPLAGAALGAGFNQIENDPREWMQGVAGYARRYASIEGYVAVQNALAFGLDATMHDDPRYFRSTRKGFFPRLAHAFSYSFITRSDSGSERFNTWRLASNYGGAWIVNAWEPHRLTTTGDVLVRGTLGLGLDTATNIGSEFWPEMKSAAKKIFHRK